MKYISVVDYLGENRLEELNDVHKGNVNTLIPKVNEMLEKFGEYRTITSGYRSLKKHVAIYNAKNEKRVLAGIPPLAIPMGSKHLNGCAVDLEDSDGKLKEFLTEEKLVEFDLYMEAKEYCDGWCHLQILAPKSGKRTFIP